MNFNKHINSAEIFLLNTAEELGNPSDIKQASRLLRAVFRTLRKRLTVEESFNLLANFPLLIKGLYIDGWQPSSEQIKIKTIEDFIADVQNNYQQNADQDLGNDQTARQAVAATFRAIKRHSSLGEVLDISATLPHELRDFWISS